MGPLQGIRIIEFAGIGPGPFAGMMLADMGAEILRIDRKSAPESQNRMDPTRDIPSRGRRSITLDLKKPEAVAAALKLIEKADGLIEGFRPGVMERLGLGPDACHAVNPGLVYGRMTGWGQSGPLSGAAGHDINYIALSGALWAIGDEDRPPVPPLNLLGDFGGGGMMLAFGIVCGLLRAQATGKGDVVDAAICDGTAALMAPVYSQLAKGNWINKRQSNRLDGGAPYYGVYECADGRWICIAPLEDKFFSLFLHLLRLDDAEFADRKDPANWKAHREILEGVFKKQPREYWEKLLEGTDVCFAPVLDLEEADKHPHNRAREIFVEKDGLLQTAPAPRFRDNPPELPSTPPEPGAHNGSALTDWGLTQDSIAELKKADAL